MAMRGWETVTRADLAKLGQQPPKPSKYHNVKTEVHGVTFASKREASHYIALRAREHNGEISALEQQVPFPLYCPIRIDGVPAGSAAIIAHYVADFVYTENGVRVVCDVKGKRTREYLLKRKWLSCQDGITILEV